MMSDRTQRKAPTMNTIVMTVLFFFFLSKDPTRGTATMGAHASKSAGLAAEIQGSEEIMKPKAHGTCPRAPPNKLRWKCSRQTADRICCFNRHYAEHSGYWLQTEFLASVQAGSTAPTDPITFYDTITGKPLFVAPKGRSWKAFVKESRAHGWPSFRDEEVVTENVRVLRNGEAVSVDGTHLGHNLPDRKGNRYCINLVSVAWDPDQDDTKTVGGAGL